MSSKLQVAILGIAVCLAACGDDAEVGTSGAGGGDGTTAGSGLVIVGSSSGSTTSGPASISGAGASDGGGDATASGGADATSGGGGGGGGTGGGGSGAGGDGSGGETVVSCPDFASEVVDVVYGPGAGFGQDDFPDVVFGGPRGAGETAGSLHVLSLGNGGSIVLGFDDRRIVDGDGPDFIVFENAFWAGGDPEAPYAELGTVSVSDDGETWHDFSCTAQEAPYGSCAGWRPVLANVERNEIDPLDPEVAGGDAFDLADVGLAEARWVRIVDRGDQAGFAGMFDLDAVAIVHGTCPAAD